MPDKRFSQAPHNRCNALHSRPGAGENQGFRTRTAPFGWLPTDNDGHSFRIPHRLYSLHNSHIRTRHDQSVRTIFQPPSGGVWHRSDKPRYILHTFRTAIPAFVRHFRLHPRFYRRRRTQDIIGASRYTQLTGRAMRSEIVQPLRSRRFLKCTLRSGIFFSSITANPPSTFFSCALIQEPAANHEATARKLRRPLSGPPFRSHLDYSRRTDITYGSLRAFVYAVHTSHATAVIYLMFLNMDTRCLAITFAQIAIHTL